MIMSWNIGTISFNNLKKNQMLKMKIKNKQMVIEWKNI